MIKKLGEFIKEELFDDDANTNAMASWTRQVRGTDDYQQTISVEPFNITLDREGEWHSLKFILNKYRIPFKVLEDGEVEEEEEEVLEALVGGNSPQERSIDLRGPEGNAYAIMGLAQQLCKQLSEVDPERYDITKILDKMKSSDYKNLVHTFEEYFGDYVTIYNADVLDESKVQKFDNFINENYDEKIKEFLLSHVSEKGILRKLMSKDEIRIANELVKSGELSKGVSDDKQKTVCYFPI